MPFYRTTYPLAEFHQKPFGYTVKEVHLLSRHQIEEDKRQAGNDLHDKIPDAIVDILETPRTPTENSRNR
jgi:hypothetical protein